jgi:hypothetical protein
MDLKIKLSSLFIVITSLLAGPLAFASSSASCTMNGTWEHIPGTGQVCSSYVCCSNGSKTAWTAGVAKDAAGWCKRWGAAPATSCEANTLEYYNNMTLTDMAMKSGKAGGYPLAQVQCRFDRECDRE